MLRQFVLCIAVCTSCAIAVGEDLSVTLTSQEKNDLGQFQATTSDEVWQADQTAVIVCDMWDAHHCYRAVRREEQMVPRMESLLTALRERGVTVIHAPSSCVDAYADHPARKRVAAVPKLEPPEEINSWCHSIPAEEAGKYPIDQEDGGEDDTPEEHAAWASKLAAKGLDPKKPWKKQHDGLTIDGGKDFISDRGDEVWSIIQEQQIQNVILVGVHTNMCVLGRPFGLRQLTKNGVHAVLMRDLTDSMYNPKAWPHVSHQEGTQLIIEHIEKYVCPTITSDQIIGGEPFRFHPITAEQATPK